MRRVSLAAVVVALASALAGGCGGSKVAVEPTVQCGPIVQASGGTTEPPVIVLLIGDSLMAEPSCVIARALSHSGVTTYRAAIAGTGLLTGSTDWVAWAQQLLAMFHPRVVVVEFAGAYPYPPVRNPSGQPVLDGTPDFYAAWQARAARLSAVLRTSGATVYWVQPPPPRSVGATAKVQRLFDGYRTLGDRYLDSAARAVAGPHGEYVETKPSCGTSHPLRLPDGVHFSGDGARVYGQALAHDLTQDLGLPIVPDPC